ncbi:MAG TPA: hypothetical protein DDW41_03690 [Candidatus Andersenbacteria bacterium]|nr:hypothetical protein [Candidatus Andersenbacteria bacterium]
MEKAGGRSSTDAEAVIIIIPEELAVILGDLTTLVDEEDTTCREVEVNGVGVDGAPVDVATTQVVIRVS